MKKKTGLFVAIVLVLYALLLGLLTAAESGYASSGIHGFTDALWYSLVTITTVGYGDLYPVSPLGRVIGAIFLMLSMGFLAFLASAIYSLLSGRLWPSILLSVKRNRHWFLFSEKNAASETLAQDLQKKYPQSLMIFCGISDRNKLPNHANQLFLMEDIVEVVHHYKLGHGKKTAFLISESEFQNRDDAYALLDSGTELYCRSEEAGETQRIFYFDPFECCARQYWKTKPVRSHEQCILIVGDGRYAQALLNNALITNCRVPAVTTQYHLFGSWQDYKLDHYCLGQAMAIDREEPGRDVLFFHERPWNADAELIARADRIIFCFEDEVENARCAQRLERRFAHRAAVYTRTSHQVATGTCFGGAAEIYTAELVMKRQLDRAAKQLHEWYRHEVSASVPRWDELDTYKKASNRAATDHIPTKLRLLLQSDTLGEGSLKHAMEIYRNADAALIELCRRNEHERWMRFQSLHNWQYAPVRDNAARRHPQIMPYDQLSDAERCKDDFAWQQLESMSEAANRQEYV